jgi:site-specific recombinase XerD
MRIEETWVRHAADTPKSQAGHRTIALGRKLADELWQHRQRTPFAGDDERVFANPRSGRPFGADRYAEILRMALDKVGIEERIRPSHDLRHSSITNAAAAGTPPEALMQRAGHSAYSTTRLYVDLAGERFRDEADRLEERLWGRPVESSGRRSAAEQAEAAAEKPGIGLNERRRG